MRRVTKIFCLIGVIWLSSVSVEAEDWSELLSRADSLADLQQFTEAVEIASEALAAAEAVAVDSAIANVLHRQGLFYYFLGDGAATEPLWQRALEIRKGFLGEKHERVAVLINNLANLYSDYGLMELAEEYFGQALEVYEELYGPDHANVGDVIGNLANLYRDSGRPVKAEEYFKRALSIKEATYGPEGGPLAIELNNLGMLYSGLGRFAEADSLVKRALAIVVAQEPVNRMLKANTITNLALICFNTGRYSEAEERYQQTLALQLEIFPEESDPVIRTRTNIAILHRSLGRYEEAERVLRHSLKLIEASPGANPVSVASLKNSLGTLLGQTGHFAEAEPLHLESLRIRKELFGPQSPEVVMVLNELAGMYKLQGRYESAERTFEEALEIAEALYEEGHPDISLISYNLAIVYSENGQPDRAEELYREVLENDILLYGSENLEVARDYRALGGVSAATGRYERADSLYHLSLKLTRSSLSPEHPEVASLLSVMALAKQHLGEYDEARVLLEQALAIELETLGPDHPALAQSKIVLSGLFRVINQPDSALLLAEQAWLIRRGNFEANALVLSERDALTYSELLRLAAENFISCYVDLPSANASQRLLAYEIILSSKGQVSDQVFDRRRSLRLSSDSAAIPLEEAYREARHLLAQQYVQGDQTDPTSYRHALDSLIELANQTEAALARHSITFRERATNREIKLAGLESVIPSEGGLIEYLKFDYFAGGQGLGEGRYLALVIRANQAAEVFDLGQAGLIDSLVEEYRAHLLRVSSMGLPIRADLEEYQQIALSLSKLIWQPLERELADLSELLISPDGGLNLISFASLIGSEGRYLVEDFAIGYLTSGRDLMRFESNSVSGVGLLALGDPDYSASLAMRMSEGHSAEKGITVNFTDGISLRGGCGDLKLIKVSPLPGTRLEVEMISAEWEKNVSEEITVFFGPQASEERFKSEASGKRTLYLATHGYFLEGACRTLSESAEGRSGQSYVGDNPLLLSGLFLAGANLKSEPGMTPEGEDGVLTAYEVAAMDLAGTELVVLSACETGLGVVSEGEGVYGLRKAFQVAGVRTVLSALWPVSDEGTAKMMGSLYTDLSLSIPKRLQRIQLEQIKHLRSEDQADHPSVWAAFISIGDWR